MHLPAEPVPGAALRPPATPGNIGKMGQRAKRSALAALTPLFAAAALAACGGPAKSADAGKSVSVFDLRPQQCLDPPKANPNLVVSDISVVHCSQPHVDEVYCVIPYSATVPSGPRACPSRPPRLAGSLTAQYPGEPALSKFAAAACLNEFEPYVGAPYTQSSLYYTYLYPSPRSWDDPVRRDRTIVCVLHTAGAPLTRSAKGSKL